MTDTFSIASFNVLARCYSHHKFMPWVDPGVLDWDRRRNHLESVYADCDASILCLQEVDETDFHMTALNRLGFETVYQARPEKQDGLLTAFRSEQFELFGDTHSIDFNDLCDFENANSELASSDTTLAPIVGAESRNPDRFRRGNVASLLPLRHLASGRRLLLANTHIYWNPRHEDVKLAQCRMLLHRIHVLRQQLLQLDNSPIAVVVAGDFNSLPSSLVYQFLIEGRCQPNTFLRPDAKLMLDHDKLKLVHYLRSIGVDAEWAADRDLKAVFDKCTREDRVFITRSRNAVRRAACPSYVLLPSADAELNFRQLVASFRFKVDASTVYSKCIACNSRYEKVPHSRYSEMNVPELLRSGFDRAGNALEFFQCVSCKNVYWWGHQTNQGLHKIVDMLRPVIRAAPLEALLRARAHLDMLPNKGSFRKEESSDCPLRFTTANPAPPEIAILGPASPSASDEVALSDQLSQLKVDATEDSQNDAEGFADAWRPEMFTHPFHLRSAVRLADGVEPEATNITSQFIGTLDYIFIEPSSLQVISAKPVQSVVQVEADGWLPSMKWPSDHLLIQAEFKFL